MELICSENGAPPIIFNPVPAGATGPPAGDRDPSGANGLSDGCVEEIVGVVGIGVIGAIVGLNCGDGVSKPIGTAAMGNANLGSVDWNDVVVGAWMGEIGAKTLGCGCCCGVVRVGVSGIRAIGCGGLARLMDLLRPGVCCGGCCASLCCCCCF